MAHTCHSSLITVFWWWPGNLPICMAIYYSGVEITSHCTYDVVLVACAKFCISTLLSRTRFSLKHFRWLNFSRPAYVLTSLPQPSKLMVQQEAFPSSSVIAALATQYKVQGRAR